MAFQPQTTPQSPTTSPYFSPYMHGGENSTVPLELIYGLDEYAGYQGLNLCAMMTSGGGLVAGPITSPMDVTPRDGLDPHLSKAFIQNNRSNVRRRMQNREAQRRFRERREQEQKTLQQVADDLRTEYLALCDQHAKSTTEVSRLLEENDALRSEVKNLRQRWRLMLAVLQWPEDSHPPSSPGGDAAFFDDVRRCLGRLADKPSPHSPS
ncbi:putative bZIP transcription factor [Fusarium oxysporum]|nr:putative bZIP transcription factor [Fusarium oxysporum]KAK2685071.1 hypothetical protein QWA68_016138 [Fusarium oxysporum]